MQPPNDIPISNSVKSVLLGNFLWSLKLDIFFKTKLTSIKIGKIIAP